MTARCRFILIAVASVASAAAVTMCTPQVATALSNALTVTVTDNLDPASSGGQVTYSVTVKNDGANLLSSNATNVLVKLAVPSSTTFVKCSTSPKVTCTFASGSVSALFTIIKSRASVNLSVAIQLPIVNVKTLIQTTAGANGDNALADQNSTTTTILPPHAPVRFLPSLRTDTAVCGETLSATSFGSDLTVQLMDGLGCAVLPAGVNHALQMAAPGKTLDLNGNKIIGGALASNLGNVGVFIPPGVTNVTIDGSGTAGSNGIEYFDWCLMDGGGNSGLIIQELRCFRGRSAGLDLVSDGVLVANSLIDKTVGGGSAATEIPGGVGIHASGNTHINQTIVRRSAVVGIWADGTVDSTGTHLVLIDGNQATSRIESSSGVGIRLDGGAHTVKDTLVQGDGTAAATSGIVVNSAGGVIDGAAVKSFQNSGIFVSGTGARVTRSTVEAIALDGYVINGSGAALSGNSATTKRHGFVVNGSATLDTNTAERSLGNGFVVTAVGATTLSNNTASLNSGRGFVLSGGGVLFQTNLAQSNKSDGFLVSGVGNRLVSNRSKQNSSIGFNVSGNTNHFNSNAAELNGGREWVIAPNNVDDGGNKKNGAAFTFTSAGGTFE